MLIFFAPSAEVIAKVSTLGVEPKAASIATLRSLFKVTAPKE